MPGATKYLPPPPEITRVVERIESLIRTAERLLSADYGDWGDLAEVDAAIRAHRQPYASDWNRIVELATCLRANGIPYDRARETVLSVDTAIRFGHAFWDYAEAFGFPMDEWW